jgi:outer membrane murein-binding lipoprotein Lpp
MLILRDRTRPIVVPDADNSRFSQPGDAPMMGSKLALAAVIGAATMMTPSQAAADDMAEAVKKLEAAVKKLEATDKSLTDYKLSNATAVRQLQDDVESLKSRVRQLEDDVRTLRAAPAPSSTSKFGPGNSATRTGRIKLSNDYLEEMSIVVNGMSYRLAPGQTRTISVPAGPFTYQVLQLQRMPQERYINPDEEKPIRIYTQPY